MGGVTHLPRCEKSPAHALARQSREPADRAVPSARLWGLSYDFCQCLKCGAVDFEVRTIYSTWLAQGGRTECPVAVAVAAAANDRSSTGPNRSSIAGAFTDSAVALASGPRAGVRARAIASPTACAAVICAAGRLAPDVIEFERHGTSASSCPDDSNAEKRPAQCCDGHESPRYSSCSGRLHARPTEYQLAAKPRRPPAPIVEVRQK